MTYSRGIGSQTPRVHGTQTRRAVWSNRIRTVWETDGPIPPTSTGNGDPVHANSQSSIPTDFLIKWDTNHGLSSAIPSLAIMSNHCFAFSLRSGDNHNYNNNNTNNTISICLINDPIMQALPSKFKLGFIKKKKKKVQTCFLLI